MKKILGFLLLVVVLILGAYVAGYWPARGRLAALESEKVALQQRADAAEAKVRVGRLLGELLTLKETVQEMNYGQARGISSPFFDNVRAEAGRTADPSLRQALESVQAQRDQITIALTQGDAAALQHLREAERRLRAALGYPAPPATAAVLPAPAATPLPGTVLPGTVDPGSPPASMPPASPLPGAASATPPPPGGNPLGVPPAATPTPGATPGH